MNETKAKLTVFFEDPFWVAVYERWEGCGSIVGCRACKITFGAEPSDMQVWEMLLAGFHRFRFSPAVQGDMPASRPRNPKRAQRAAKDELDRRGPGTKAQQALALQREAGKAAGKARSRQEKERDRQRRFDLRQEKRRAKHRGH